MLTTVPERVIFDMDGLIFDSERVFMRELREEAKKYGYDITRDRYIKTLGLTGAALRRQTMSMFGADYPHEDLSRRARERVSAAALGGRLPVKSGIRELLLFLKERGIPCAVASSTHRKYVDAYLNAAGLGKFFDTVTGGDMAPRSKPEPDIFLLAAAGTPPDKALVLEDSENGILAAFRARIPVICVPDMAEPSEEIRRLTAGVVSEAADVIKMIREAETR